MIKKITILAAVFGVAACSPDVDQPQAQEDADRIECALGQGSDFGPDCLVERQKVDAETVLIVRHPDGGFRRFVQVDDGRGLVELDGADEVFREVQDGILSIRVGDDQYRFPARLQSVDGAAQ